MATSVCRLAVLALAGLSAVDAFMPSTGSLLPLQLRSSSIARKATFGPSMELALVTGAR
jgi:hypothetical protein